MSSNGHKKKDKVNVDLRPMESGELQLRKVFEENAVHNIRQCVNHSNETRSLFRELEIKVNNLQKTILTKNVEIEQMNKKISVLLQDKFQSGS